MYVIIDDLVEAWIGDKNADIGDFVTGIYYNHYGDRLYKEGFITELLEEV